MADSIHFPELRSYRIEYRLPFAALASLAAAMLWPQARWAGMICLGAALALFLPMLWKDFQNARIRRRWARSFARQIHPAGIGELVRAHPGRYRLHVRCYRGFGMNTIKSAALIEDTTTGECLPVLPPVKDVHTLSERHGIQIEQH